MLLGYNGNFGDYDNVIDKRNAAYGNRSDGKPWVKPENVVPSRIYIGIKGKMEDGKDCDINSRYLFHHSYFSHVIQ